MMVRDHMGYKGIDERINIKTVLNELKCEIVNWIRMTG
jgi:hypothetical protein